MDGFAYSGLATGPGKFAPFQADFPLSFSTFLCQTQTRHPKQLRQSGDITGNCFLCRKVGGTWTSHSDCHRSGAGRAACPSQVTPCRGPGDREHRGDIHNVAPRVPTPQSCIVARNGLFSGSGAGSRRGGLAFTPWMAAEAPASP